MVSGEVAGRKLMHTSVLVQILVQIVPPLHAPERGCLSLLPVPPATCELLRGFYRPRQPSPLGLSEMSEKVPCPHQGVAECRHRLATWSIPVVGATQCALRL